METFLPLNFYVCLLSVVHTWSVRKEGLYDPSALVFPLPLRDFIWDTAIRRMVSLSGFRASALQVGTMSDSSVIYAVILFRLRLSISL